MTPADISTTSLCFNHRKDRDTLKLTFPFHRGATSNSIILMRIFKIFLLVSCIFFACPVLGSCRSLKSNGLPSYETTLFNQINTYRKYVDLPPLRINTHLTRLARRHSFSMFRQKRLSHANFKTRFLQSGSRSCVENVGHNHSAPLKQFDAWRTSQGHDENMLNPEIRSVGLAKVGSFVTFFACH